MPAYEFKQISFHPTLDKLQNTIRQSRFIQDFKQDLKEKTGSFRKEMQAIIKKCNKDTDKLFEAYQDRKEELDWYHTRKKALKAKDTFNDECCLIEQNLSLFQQRLQKLSQEASESNESTFSKHVRQPSNNSPSNRGRYETTKSSASSVSQVVEDDIVFTKDKFVSLVAKSNDVYLKNQETKFEGENYRDNGTVVVESKKSPKSKQSNESTTSSNQNRMATRSRQSQFQMENSKLVSKPKPIESEEKSDKQSTTESQTFQHKVTSLEKMEQTPDDDMTPVKTKDVVSNQENLLLPTKDSKLEVCSSSISPSSNNVEVNSINAKSNKTLSNSSTRRYGSTTKRWNRGVRTVRPSVRKAARRVITQSAKKGQKKKNFSKNLTKNFEQAKQPSQLAVTAQIVAAQPDVSKFVLEYQKSGRQDANRAIEHLQMLKRMVDQNFALLLNSLPDDVLNLELNQKIEYICTQDPNDVIMEHLRKVHQETKMPEPFVRVINPLEESDMSNTSCSRL